MERNLDTLRNEIDIIDKSVLELFYKRMNLCKEVADYKKNNNLPVFQGGREQQIFDKVRSLSPEGFGDVSVSLFTDIMEISKILQQREIYSDVAFIQHDEFEISSNAKIACPGTVGSNSQTAALKIFPDNEIIFYSDFEDVCKAVENGDTEYGILPVHNSTAGSVIQTYDILEKYRLFVSRSTTVPVEHCFVARQEVNLSDIKKVYSHPQALSQCSNYIKEHSLEAENFSNTALAAEMISKSDEPLGAICSEYCANKLGLKIIEKGINDVYPNVTKFFCISKKCLVPKNANKISILLTIPNKCGSLYKLLTKFFVNGLNMTKIESRPLKNGSFDVSFYIEFDGNIEDEKVSALLCDLRNNTEGFKFIGNYDEI